MKFAVVAIIGLTLCHSITVQAQAILSDNFNVTGNGTGFGLNAGVNSGINPPATRLTGTAAANLRYIPTFTKTNTAFGIAGNKLRVTSAPNPGRFTLSADGTTPFDFASALGSATATAAKPVVYDLAIRMANSSAGVQRFSFALATAEGDATTWDFGVQLYRSASSDNFYTIGKRIDTAASGLPADLNTFVTNTTDNTYGTEIAFLIRVTDAGSETTTFHSRVQLSLDDGLTWFYDTASDPDLPNGWRLNGPGRYILFDIAPDAGNVTYDGFSVRPVPVTASLIAPTDNAQGFGASANLRAVASNSIPGPVSVTFYGRQAAASGAGRDFLIVVMPDTQNYSDYSHDGLHNRFYYQTEWVITNRVAKNIAYVAQLGDIVQNGDVVNGGPNDEEWQVATNAMYRLENPTRTLLPYGIPYGCCVGNHDQEPNGDEDGTTTHYNQYFGSAHFAGKPYYGGHYSSNNDNFFNLFSAGGMDFIVFSFEYGRYGSGVLDWAEAVLATNQNRRIIVMTHHAGSDYTPSNLSAQGQAIYDRLKVYPNFFLMLGGHVFNGDGWGEGSRSDTYNGHTVRTLISDYQNRPSGGDGLMRLMFFSPSNNMVNVQTYSPYTGAFETDSDSQFSFPYNMQAGGIGGTSVPFVALKTNGNVGLGAETSFVWSGLQPNQSYEWYVQVTDAFGNSVRSPIRRFSTGVNSAPVASNLNLTITGDQPSLISLGGFDANGDPLTYRTNTLPVRGLNSGFNAANGTLTYLPAHGYRGFDQFQYQVNDGAADSSVGLVTLNIIAPADANTNGLPDGWEAIYGVSDPAADDDGDGLSNLAEYWANTNPTNATSALRITQSQLSPAGIFTMSWSSIGGSRYRVQAADGGTNGGIPSVFTDIFRPVSQEMDSSAYGSPSTQSFSENTGSAATNGSRYYRVRVAP